MGEKGRAAMWSTNLHQSVLCCVFGFSDVMASYEMASRSSLLFEPPNVTTCAQAAHFIDSKTHRSCQAFQHMIEAPGLCVTKYNPFCTHYNKNTSVHIIHIYLLP
jgi:hypothetical protein